MIGQVYVGTPLSFELTLEFAGLFVALSVYDDSGASPSLIAGPTAMTNVFDNSYRGKFTPVSAKPYLVKKAVYTDGTFTTTHPDYQGYATESFSAVVAPTAISEWDELTASHIAAGSFGELLQKLVLLSQGLSGSDLIGILDDDGDLTGTLEDGDDELLGVVVEC